VLEATNPASCAEQAVRDARVLSCHPSTKDGIASHGCGGARTAIMRSPW